jgi:hypothetical protein
MTPDYDEIRRNAALEGISLSEIAILYRGLTEDEILAMESRGLVARKSGDTLIGRFSEDGSVMFPEKSTGVIHL